MSREDGGPARVRGWAVTDMTGNRVAEDRYKLRAMVKAGLFDEGPREIYKLVRAQVAARKENDR